MQALILAGGQGTRLRPHTEALPKPLLKLGEDTILDRQIATLTKLGITRITIITGFFAEKLHAHIQERHADLDIQFVHNAEFAHSRPAFAILNALPHLHDDDCIYLNGDVLYHAEILARIYQAPHASATAIQNTPWDEEQVKVIIAPDQTIKHISKNIALEESQGEFIGVTKLGRDLLHHLREIATHEGVETFRYAFAIDLLDHAINTRHATMGVVDVSDLPAIEIDTPEDYARAASLAVLLET